MMNNKAAGCIIFAAGAAVGSFVTCKFLKKKYEQIAEEEINSVKEVFSKREANLNEQINEAHTLMMENDAREASFIADLAGKNRENGYTDYTAFSQKSAEVEKELMDKPYVISPDEFGENEGYDKISIMYYADHVLADDNDEIIDNVDEIIGFDSLEHFGEYEDDSVFVRNDKLKCDYEILLDGRKYSDVVDQIPY